MWSREASIFQKRQKLCALNTRPAFSAPGFISFFVCACARVTLIEDYLVWSACGARGEKWAARWFMCGASRRRAHPQFLSLGLRPKGPWNAYNTCPGKASANKNQPASGLWCRTYACMCAPLVSLFFNKKGKRIESSQNWAHACVPAETSAWAFLWQHQFFLPRPRTLGVWSHCQMEEKKADENLIWLRQSHKWQPNDFECVSACELLH